jgi:HAD superfamily hydrolase (TIGR01459 family)
MLKKGINSASINMHLLLLMLAVVSTRAFQSLPGQLPKRCASTISHRHSQPLAFMTSTDSTSTSSRTLKLVSGIRDIVDDYDVFLLDMWGVMHDGFNAYEGVIDTIKQLRQANKTLIILSNSSQRRNQSISNLKGMGFDPLDDFDAIITSGEVAFLMLSIVNDNDSNQLEGCQRWDVLTHMQDKNHRANQANKIFVLGSEPKRDVPYIESCGWKFAPIEEADLILTSGTFSVNDGVYEINKRQDANAYEAAVTASLKIAAERGIPMIVSNPDKLRPDYERPPMPGKLGDRYEAALVEYGGKTSVQAEALVKRIGKPFSDVYDIALKASPNNNGASVRACMVGDALETDITGGSAAGIDTVWILKDGVYIPEIEEADGKGKTLLEAATEILRDFNQKKEGTYAKGQPDQLPTVAMPHFRW